ncbi:MAG: DUF2892 domain-containing protein [Cytophagaceae bacterium]|nr:DUF2892 domain-containing protein [Cytophagaceae bacterium]
MESKSNINVSGPERIASVTAGSALLFRSLTGKRKSVLNAALGAYLVYRGATGNCIIYSAFNKKRLPNPAHNITIETSLIVNKPVREVYEFWRRLENLPLFMTHLKSVEEWDETLSEWKASVPGGLGTISWKAEIVKQYPNHMIGWQSLHGATIENAGNVRFREINENSTAIEAKISYRAPLGIVGEKVARLFTPLFEKLVTEDVQNFKNYIETEEYLLSDRNDKIIYE